jgi:hypothetical protein
VRMRGGKPLDSSEGSCECGLFASELGGEDTWRLLATSFDGTSFAPRIFHYRWPKCGPHFFKIQFSWVRAS